MGITVGVIGAVAAVAGTTASVVAGNQQRAAQRHAADLQTQAQNESRADNAAKAAQERRQQVRDERIRRARVEQASVNTGTEGSSGELGALSSITTQTNSNIGFNLGALNRADNISIFNQEAADTLQAGRDSAGFTQNVGSIFQGVGGAASSFGKTSGKTI